MMHRKKLWLKTDLFEKQPKAKKTYIEKILGVCKIILIQCSWHKSNWIVTFDIPNHDGLCIMGEYTLEVITSQINIAHANYHLHKPYSVSSDCQSVFLDTILRHARLCDINVSLARGIHACRSAASKWFPNVLTHLKSHLLLSILCTPCSCPYNVLILLSICII